MQICLVIWFHSLDSFRLCRIWSFIVITYLV
ncbi:hypothetical protein ES332_D09G197600v1 [Gossypium tomentosum]|uniref:Uncharacterized protein n=1 Tax=Gossypium tomentosum TaxID=34277 RepID=A0A5D2JK34_GOSTO|nr:hypothetical protein ES332_D09G197600v1 [Gossypium tomentosum]